MKPRNAQIALRALAGTLSATVLFALPTLAEGQSSPLAAAVKPKPAKPVVFTYSDIKKCAKPTGSVKIGSEFELSGLFAAQGRPGAKGVAMAVSEITNGGKGGFLVGKKCFGINLIEKDIRSDPATTVAVTRELVQDQGVKFLLGPVNGSNLISAYQISQAGSPKPIHIAVSVVLEQRRALGVPAYGGMYRALAPGTINVDAVTAGLRKFYPRAKTVHFLFPDDVTTQYYFGIGGFTKKFSAQRLRIVADDRYPSSTTDFSSYLLRVKAANPDVFLVGYFPTAITQVVKQAMQFGVKSTIVMFNGTPSIALKDVMGRPLDVPALNIALGPDMQNPTTPAMKAFVRRYVRFTRQPVGTNSFVSSEFYEPTYMLIKAMQTAGTTTNVNAVNRTLLRLRLDGAVGRVCWHRDHIAITPITLTNIVKGRTTTYHYQPSTKLCVKQ